MNFKPTLIVLLTVVVAYTVTIAVGAADDDDEASLTQGGGGSLGKRCFISCTIPCCRGGVGDAADGESDDEGAADVGGDDETSLTQVQGGGICPGKKNKRRFKSCFKACCARLGATTGGDADPDHVGADE